MLQNLRSGGGGGGGGGSGYFLMEHMIKSTRGWGGPFAK